MSNNLLPQFYIGAFPYCFTLPKWNGQSTSMGQAPGTHWYHAHKHGSTAINLANGMAGALIIEGDYDATLKQYYTNKAATLNEKAGWFHSLLFKLLHIHTVPTLRFIHDEGIERGLHLARLIDEANRTDGGGTLPPPDDPDDRN